MSKLLYMVSGIALAAAIGASGANADNNSDGFPRRDTRIQGCIAMVDKVRDGTMSPTEWMEQNREEFLDIELELKKRKYSPEKAKKMLMGKAISLCMERKGYVNKCKADSDNEDADLQEMETAHVYACWRKRERAERPVPPLNAPNPPIAIPVPPPPIPVPVAPPPPPALPVMSAADVAQFNEDMAIISQAVRIIGDDEGGKKEARFSECYGYWQGNLSYNRTPDARHLLFSVRVARCMFRTNYAIFRGRCPWAPGSDPWQQAAGRLLTAGCYARF
jgi:hypothetical protein